MCKLRPNEIEEIAAQYMKLNSNAGDSVGKLYELYMQAIDDLGQIESSSVSEHITGSGWGV